MFMEKIINFWELTTQIKTLVRTGWKYWNVTAERLESVAEHSFGVCMLAIGIYDQMRPKIDLNRVLRMLVLHDVEEAILGDITPFDLKNKDKDALSREAIAQVFAPLNDAEFYINLLQEFNDHQTADSLFAFRCDKLEAALQAKRYEELGVCDINNPTDFVKNIGLYQNYRESGINKVCECFILNDIDKLKIEGDPNEAEWLDLINKIKFNPLPLNSRECFYIKLATLLHENWRKTRINDGKIEPKWRSFHDVVLARRYFENPDKFPNIRTNGENLEMDIANTPYEDLSRDWQQENMAASRFVGSLAFVADNMSLAEIGDKIHKERLLRRPWNRAEPKLNLPFDKLSEAEKQKDLQQYFIAKDLLKNFFSPTK